ncbi:DUF3482 domain-containing protein [Inhella gelatinilytica]|nr:DUF3482 domain-containing protein [Inhella gelatinilytica]
MIQPGRTSQVEQDKSIHIFVAAHTNVGKTALLRTILGKDVGVVEDAPDITSATASHSLVADADGSALLIWDSPGFGDSFRLARRFRLRYRWLTWLVREVWDRRVQPSLWRSQRLVLDLQKQADIVLYPVNLLERPAEAVYVAPELEVLGWTGKPVVVILNQSGSRGDAISRIAEWREFLGGFPAVRSVIDLDAFTRCWLQELKLFEEIGRLLPDTSHQSYQRLAKVLTSEHLKRFDESIAAIVDHLMQTAGDRAELDTAWFSGVAEAIDLVRNKLPWGKSKEQRPQERAMEDLAQRLATRVSDLANRLVAINRLNGVTSADVLRVAATHMRVDGPLNASTVSLVGSVVSGVLTGLSADLISGGLTLGTGALVGGVMGALGGAVIAQGYNVLTSKDKKVIRWSPKSIFDALDNSILLYLSVAHFGRGQGDWRKKDAPSQWSSAVLHARGRYQYRLDQLCSADGLMANAQRDRREYTLVVRGLLQEVLIHLYPSESAVLSSEGPAYANWDGLDTRGSKRDPQRNSGEPLHTPT